LPGLQFSINLLQRNLLPAGDILLRSRFELVLHKQHLSSRHGCMRRLLLHPGAVLYRGIGERGDLL
jgi:hypothetical protein